MQQPWAWALLMAIASCSGGDPAPPLSPLSQECDECLRREGDDGCGDAYESCTANDECKEHILCELRQQCYHEPADMRCIEQRGCDVPADADAASDADAFEACARDTCRSACGFREE